MTSFRCRLSRAIPQISFVGLCASLLVGPPVSATTFVMMSDQDLTDLAPVIVEASVVSNDPTPTLDLPSTDYMIEVERVLKGAIPGSTLIVRVPGGVRSDGVGFHVYGAPRFEIGDRALLFLSPATDGTYRIYQLMLGAFYEQPIRGERLAVRNFAEGAEVELPGRQRTEKERRQARAPRKLEEFSTWITDRVGGNRRAPDYYFEPATGGEGLASQVDAFTHFRDSVDHMRMRWFAFDQGQTEGFRVHQDGQPGLTMQQFETAVKRGTAAWDAVSGTNIRYSFVGTTTATGGLRESPIGADNVNAVVTGDPNNSSRFGGPYNCFSGGVLAFGGPWFTTSTQVGPGGERFHQIVEGDIVTNKNLGCFFDASQNRQAAADELFTHELGHTLGIGHSCADADSGPCDTTAKGDAIMRANIHDDGRGARLNEDDKAAVRELYPAANSGKPAAPANLTATAVSSTEVQLGWTDKSSNEESFEIQQRVDGTGVGFQTVTGVFGPNTTMVVLGSLQPGVSYSHRVRARNGAGSSGFSNVATVVTPAAPNAPSDLEALPMSSSQVMLTWSDNSTDEQSFSVEMSSPDSGGFQPTAVVAQGSEQAMISGLDPDTPYTFRVQATNSLLPSDFSNEASASTKEIVAQPCEQDGQTLCLINDRFRVRVQWRDDQSGDTGIGHAITVPGSDITGLFWFFSPNNIELVIKTLDATSFSGFYWNFYGALSNVEYWITVTDTDADESVTYHNPQGEICGLPDTHAFPRFGGPTPTASNSSHRPRVIRGETRPLIARRRVESAPGLESLADTGATGTCVPSDTSLCLLDNRFRVEVDWDNSLRSGNSDDHGVGHVRPVSGLGTDESGFFWFFDSSNLELVVKVLDAQVLNGHFWVFYGGLSDVEYRITVTDTATGNFKVFTNPAGDFCGDADTGTL